MNTLIADPWAHAWARNQACLAAGGAEQALAAIDPEMRAAAVAEDWVGAVALAEVVCSLALRTGQVPLSDSVAAEAEQWARRSGDPRALGAVSLARARLAYHLGDPSAALAAVEQACRDASVAEAPMQRLDCLTLLGAVLSDLGQEDLARQWHEQALVEAEAAAAARLPGADRTLARAHSNLSARLVNLGVQACLQGGAPTWQPVLQQAVVHARRAFELHQVLGIRGAMAIAKGNWALALAHLGEHAAALAALDDADELRGSDRSNHDWINSRLQRVQTWMAHGDLDMADRLMGPLMAAGETDDGRALQIRIYWLAGLLAERRGDWAQALALHKRFYEAERAVWQAGAEARARLLSVRMQTEQAQLESARLRRVSQEDPLTGLANRRSLDESLAVLHARARERGQPLSAAVMDIDHFKHVNDAYSHAVGDRVLRRVADLLKSACRGQDLAARLGGEEFVLVFEATDLPQATLVCERLRQSIEREDWDHLAPGLLVTASFGLVDLAQDSSPAAGLERADSAMYRSKREGRNRVTAGP